MAVLIVVSKMLKFIRQVLKELDGDIFYVFLQFALFREGKREGKEIRFIFFLFLGGGEWIVRL